MATLLPVSSYKVHQSVSVRVVWQAVDTRAQIKDSEDVTNEIHRWNIDIEVTPSNL